MRADDLPLCELLLAFYGWIKRRQQEVIEQLGLLRRRGLGCERSLRLLRAVLP